MTDNSALVDELLPCPFCGCEQWPITDKNDYWGPDGDHRNGCVMGSYDYCEFADKAAMITHWNQRAALRQPASDDAVERVARAICESNERHGEPSWDWYKIDEARSIFFDAARAAIRALSPAAIVKEAGGE